MIDERSLFDVFAAGIEAEREAVRLYNQGADLAGSDTPLGELFERFAREEQEHEQRLLDHYSRLKQDLRKAG